MMMMTMMMMMTTNTASSVLPLVVSIETSREPLTANTTHSIACVRYCTCYILSKLYVFSVFYG